MLHAAQGEASVAIEIASGSGCHVEYFATALPNITWQPSEFVPSPGSGGPRPFDGDRDRSLCQIDEVGCKVRFTQPSHTASCIPRLLLYVHADSPAVDISSTIVGSHVAKCLPDCKHTMVSIAILTAHHPNAVTGAAKCTARFGCRCITADCQVSSCCFIRSTSCMYFSVYRFAKASSFV